MHIEAVELRPSVADNTIRDNTRCLIVHRGGPPIEDKFDGINYGPFGPGYYWLEHAAAKHLQARAVVPGTRIIDGRNAKQQSQIGIIETSWGLAIDRPERCVPFMEAEIKHYWSQPDAYDRTGEDIRVVSMTEIQRSLASQGFGLDAAVDKDVARGAAIAVPVAAEDNDVLKEEAQARADIGASTLSDGSVAINPRGRRR